MKAKSIGEWFHMVTMYCLIKVIKVNLVRYCRISIKLGNVGIWNSGIIDRSLHGRSLMAC